MRKLGGLLGMVLLLSLSAAAQETPKSEVFLGYSLLHFNPSGAGFSSFNLNGGTGSFTFNPSSTLGGVAEFSGYHLGSADTNVFTYLFGPRISYRHWDRLTPFGQALFGGAHTTQSSFLGSGTSNSFAMALGGGLDARLTDHIGVRLGQLDYFLTRFPQATPNRLTQNNLRFSTGIVFRFGGR
ncbi:MAG TPA: outer membrane beta-barrel protein [Candidatus Acidoferrales bacterium]|nr:outer membrane beta-barrel protein [Candidatus Acidoferrales bacterium]